MMVRVVVEGGHCGGYNPRSPSHSLEGKQALPLERGALTTQRSWCP